ncbi:MAG TPA: hypothetical protein VKU00_18600, partial [Chthonomonadaceae bacterium]|nr:hypothetical protein [Chthonomonadaceae bacterium]
MWQRLLFVVLACISATNLCRADVSPEIVNRGKAATALVEVAGGKGYGSAFCIDPAGVFVTNQHVVAQVDKTVALVLNPGRKNQ